MLSAWKEWLSSLRTGGGRIFVLFALSLLFGVLTTVMAYAPPAYEKAADALVPVLALIVGALLTVLRGDIPPPKETKK